MSFKKWAWDIFETTGNLEAFLAMKEAENQERDKILGKMEVGNIEFDGIESVKKINEIQNNGGLDGANKN